jgi:hypothetical protein
MNTDGRVFGQFSDRPARLDGERPTRFEESRAIVRELKAHDGIRTRDLFLTKEVLYRLSYMGIDPPHPLIFFYAPTSPNGPRNGAGDGIRTRDPELGRLALYQLSYSRTPPVPSEIGGEGRIRTSEGISRQIYSLLPLATREPLRAKLPIGPSRWRESNSQPTDYKSVALPLSYIGASPGPTNAFHASARARDLAWGSTRVQKPKLECPQDALGRQTRRYPSRIAEKRKYA